MPTAHQPVADVPERLRAVGIRRLDVHNTQQLNTIMRTLDEREHRWKATTLNSETQLSTRSMPLPERSPLDKRGCHTERAERFARMAASSTSDLRPEIAALGPDPAGVPGAAAPSDASPSPLRPIAVRREDLSNTWRQFVTIKNMISRTSSERIRQQVAARSPRRCGRG